MTASPQNSPNAIVTTSLPELRLADVSPDTETSADLVVVVGLSRTDSDTDSDTGSDADSLTGTTLDTATAHRAGATSRVDSTTLVTGADGARVVVTGLGAGEVTPARLRDAAGAGVRAAAALGASQPVTVLLDLDLDEPEALTAAAEGALLGAYSYPGLRSTPVEPSVAAVTVRTSLEGAEELLARARTVACAVALARDWVNTPPNVLYPASFAAEAERAVAARPDTPLTIEVLDDRRLAEEGYGAITAVGGGSSRRPRLVRLSYAPPTARASFAIVGKGVTFDSGGLDLKPGASMATMKCDMGGAAAALAAVLAVADLGLEVAVTAWAPLAENLPSSTSYRRSDVLTTYSGLTVENGNTDAEGRLVMCDAIARAVEDEPDLLLDVATLTGACMIALGPRIAGVLSNDEAAVERVLAAAEAAGEEFWPLPVPDHIRAQLRSDVADLRSIGNGPRGGALAAAAFLERFTATTTWAHLDIAGPAFNEDGAWGATGKGGTGFAVRTLVETARSLA